MKDQPDPESAFASGSGEGTRAPGESCPIAVSQPPVSLTVRLGPCLVHFARWGRVNGLTRWPGGAGDGQ